MTTLSKSTIKAIDSSINRANIEYGQDIVDAACDMDMDADDLFYNFMENNELIPDKIVDITKNNEESTGWKKFTEDEFDAYVDNIYDAGEEYEKIMKESYIEKGLYI